MLITCGGQVLEVRAEDKRTNQEVQRLIAEDRQKALAFKEVLTLFVTGTVWARPCIVCTVQRG